MQAFERQDCHFVRLQHFMKIACYCCIVAILIMTCELLGHAVILALQNNPRRNCVNNIPNSKALLSKLDGIKSPCIIDVKTRLTSAVVKVGILQCNTVDLFQISALLFSILYCNFINTLYKLLRNISKIKFNPLVE